MSWLLYFFGSGLAFFFGVACVLIAVAVSLVRWRGRRTAATLAAVIGMTLAVLSGTPLPFWFYAIGASATVIWIILAQLPTPRLRIGQIALSALVTIWWLGGVAAELPHHLIPELWITDSPPLVLFGDSISAGLSDDRSNTWPRLLARAHHVEVSDYSTAGATVAQINRRIDAELLTDGLVLLEIGGNDLLGTTSNGVFARELETLLRTVCHPGREVLMFELPLPPLRNEFGRIQRRLASQYHVQMIPKRIFIQVLTSRGATSDSLHLSQAGHQLMADAVWRVIAPAYANRALH